MATFFKNILSNILSNILKLCLLRGSVKVLEKWRESIQICLNYFSHTDQQKSYETF